MNFQPLERKVMIVTVELKVQFNCLLLIFKDMREGKKLGGDRREGAHIVVFLHAMFLVS